MRKYYCDRCGEEIEFKEKGGLDNAIQADGKERRLEISERCEVPESMPMCDEWRDIHFCKKCAENFYDFVNGLEVKNIWKVKKENAE